MLGKLIKYEWKGLIKPLSILYIVLLGITILTGLLILTINPDYDDVAVGFSVLFTMLSVFIYYFGIIVCALGTMLIIAIRFYKTCYTDEAYLTHTLPVSAKQLVAAKTISSVLCHMLTLVVIGVSVILLLLVLVTHLINLGEIPVAELSEGFSEVFAELDREFASEMGISFSGYFLYLGAVSLVSSVCGIISLLGCVSLGQLYTKHRILGAIIAYFIMTFLLQIAAYVGMIPMYSKMFVAEYTGESINMFDLMHPTVMVTLIASVIIAFIMYFINIHMMTKRLNLE